VTYFQGMSATLLATGRVRAPDDAEKFSARARIGSEVPKQLTRDHRDAVLTHTTRCHAMMRCLDDHADAFRLEHILNAMGDLCGHGFLYLQAARECLDNTGEFADADNVAIRQVANVGPADDRRHVVLAMRLELDISQDNHFIVAVDFIERSA